MDENNTRRNSAQKNRKRSTTRKTFFSANTVRRWRTTTAQKNRYIRLLTKKKDKLERLLSVYENPKTTSATVDLYSFIFLVLIEGFTEDFKKYRRDIRNSRKEERSYFDNALYNYIDRHDLANMEADDPSEHIGDILKFLEWLIDLDKKHPEVKDDSEPYAKHILSIINEVFIKNRKDFLEKVEVAKEENDSSMNDLMRAFGSSFRL